MTIPLAWLQLVREKVRLLVAVTGIAFADILMFMQLGFKDTLFDSGVSIHEKLDADLVLVSSEYEVIHAIKSFSRRRLYQTLGIEGVESVSPVYISNGEWKNPETQDIYTIMVIGFNPAQSIWNFPEVNRQMDQIKISNRVIFNTTSASKFGPIETKFSQGKTIKTELNSQSVEVAGLFTLETSFAIEGLILTSDINLLRFFPERNKEDIEIGLLKLKEGVNQDSVKQEIQSQLGKYVNVFSHEEFIASERYHWAKGTPIGFIFSVGTIMGFVVGTIIVYQILYADVSDHLPEYATLKAMGYKNRYLLTLLFQEALILAILGYLPACGLAIGLYNLTRTGASLPLVMTLSRAILVLILTIIMCFCSGAIAVRRLNDADPADIF